jgi:fatty-acid desaturase
MMASLWGGLVRVFLGHHVTWSVNSVGHFFGGRRFDTPDRSTNVFWLALPSMGIPGTTTTTRFRAPRFTA